MLASYSEYMHKKAALEEYRAQYPDDADSIAKVQAALEAYESKNDVAADDPGTAREVSALTAPTEGLPSQEEISQQLSHDAPEPDRVSQLFSMLDPLHPLQPQVLATAPATTHPAGDEGAKDEWVRGDLDNPNGRVIVYDAPLAKVREDLAANPGLLDSVGLHMSSGATVEKGDSVEQAYNDLMWTKAADAAAKAGKTAYRYAKAPWLGDGKNASLLDSLSTKLKAGALPGIEGASAFVLGVDDMANFGAARAATNAGLDATDIGESEPLGPEEKAARAALEPKHAIEGSANAGGGDELVGGSATSPAKSARENSDRLEEEHPVLHTAGQVVGAVPGLLAKAGAKAVGLVSKTAATAVEQGTKALGEWSLTNGLWDAIMGTGKVAAERGVVNSTVRGGAAAASDQAIREGLQAGSRYAETGDTGTTLREAGGRVATAAAPGAALMGLGTGVRKLAGTVAEEVRTGPRYKGAPGRVEAQGVEPKLFKGHEPTPVMREAELRGRKDGGKSTLTVLANDLNEPLADAANFRQADAERVGEANRAEYYRTPEAAQTLPVPKLVETSVEKLRELTSNVPRKGLKGVAKPGAESPVKGIFNANIEGVSTRKTKTGIPLTVDEAQKFLSDENKANLDFEKLSQKKGAKVWVTPRRYDAAHADEVIEQLAGSTDDHVAAVYESALEDRKARSFHGRKGGWAEAHEVQADAEAKAAEAAQAIGSKSPRGPAKAVRQLGKSRGQSDALPALEEAAGRAGGDAPERLKGARAAQDLADIDRWSAIGGLSPHGGQHGLLGLWGLGDKAVLRAAYPAARSIERMAPGAAAGSARLLGIPTRAAMQPDKEKPPEAPRNGGSNRKLARRTKSQRKLARRQKEDQQ